MGFEYGLYIRQSYWINVKYSVVGNYSVDVEENGLVLPLCRGYTLKYSGLKDAIVCSVLLI